MIGCLQYSSGISRLFAGRIKHATMKRKMSTARSKFDFEKAKCNPSKFFVTPSEIVAASELSTEQKLELLHSWKEDAGLMQQAEAENMAGGEPNRLSEVIEAIHEVKRSRGDRP